MNLPNDTKIRFCNAMHALLLHGNECIPCCAYIHHGDGDLCEKGKHLIADNLCFADTSLEFTPELYDEMDKAIEQLGINR